MPHKAILLTFSFARFPPKPVGILIFGGFEQVGVLDGFFIETAMTIEDSADEDLFFILTFILGIPDIGDGVKIDAVIVTFALGKIGAGRSQKASFYRICKAYILL